MKQLIVGCMAMLLMIGCSSVNVQTELGKGGELGQLSSYEWFEMGETSLDGMRVDNPEVGRLVKGAVEKELMQKGYTRAAGGNPDFLISWFGAVETKVKAESINHFYSSYGYGPVASSMPLEAQQGEKTREFKEGTILLDVLDPETKKMIWRGVGTDKVLQNLDKDEVALYINRVVKSVLKPFPEAAK